MTEIQAAIGRVQLRKLSEWTRLRRRNAALLEEAFSGIPSLRVTLPPTEVGHAYYKYYVFVHSEQLKEGWSRDKIMNAVTAEGVPCFSGSCSEIYREMAFVGVGLEPANRLPAARELGESSLMFLVHPTLSEQDMSDTCWAVEKVFKQASR
jgi:dTDP-4-amino-4,6-dideoxygalactose transaminase